MATEQFDIDDPASWPMEMDGTERGESAAPAAEDAEQTAEAEAESAAPSQDAAGESADADAAAPGGERQRIDGVLTKDGQTVMPYAVLHAARREAQKAAEEARRLQEELERLRAQPSGEPASEAADLGALHEEAGDQSPAQQDAPAPEGAAAELAEVQQEITAIEAAIAENEGDDALVAALNLQLKGAQREARTLQRQVALEQAEAEAATQRAQQEADAAFADAPLLQAWAADQDRTWHSRAVQMHETALATNPEYAAMSWADRFARLPAMVEAVFGASPHGAQIQGGRRTSGAGQQDEDEVVPASMSQIPAGELPEHRIRRLEDVQALPQAEQRRVLGRMAPEQLESWLFDMPVGSLNAR